MGKSQSIMYDRQRCRLVMVWAIDTPRIGSPMYLVIPCGHAEVDQVGGDREGEADDPYWVEMDLLHGPLTAAEVLAYASLPEEEEKEVEGA